jgi:hypothetical protein
MSLINNIFLAIIFLFIIIIIIKCIYFSDIFIIELRQPLITKPLRHKTFFEKNQTRYIYAINWQTTYNRYYIFYLKYKIKIKLGNCTKFNRLSYYVDFAIKYVLCRYMEINNMVPVFCTRYEQKM